MPGLAYIQQDQFPVAIDIYATSDFVIGGTNGDSNLPLKKVIDRTFYLSKRLLRFEDVFVLSADYTFDVTTDLRRLIAYSFSGSNKTFTLPLLADVDAGTIIAITAEIASIHCLKVLANGTQILNGSIHKPALYLHDGERLLLVASAAGWQVLVADGNFDKVGDDFKSRAPRKNTHILQGQLISRTDNARLFEFVTDYLTDGHEVVDDITWLSDPLKFRGCFSTGDGSTNFRLPDERGMFDRNLDMARGIDLGRLHEYAGGYEADVTKEHEHLMFASDVRGGPPATEIVNSTEHVARSANTAKGDYAYEMSSSGSTPERGRSGTNTGSGTETRPKNIGKIPLIYY